LPPFLRGVDIVMLSGVDIVMLFMLFSSQYLFLMLDVVV
jgi:hypothetical protein